MTSKRTRSPRPWPGEQGFSLLEILVALVLIGLLVGALVPSVISQLGRGETSRIVQDLDAVGEAAQLFRVDVARWPGDPEDLVTEPTGTDEDINENTYPPGLLNKWAGPYFEDATKLKVDGTLETAAGGIIQEAFAKEALSGRDYLVMNVEGLTTEQIAELDLAIDGTAGTSTGRVQQTGSTSAPVLKYYAVPLR
jgi:type II secretion system protein G